MGKNKKLALISFLVGIEFLLAIIPSIGFIPLGVINITTLQIPVILASLLLGSKVGGCMGAFFGIISIIQNTLSPNATSFVFSPFIEISGVHGNLASLIIALVPRIACGIVPAMLAKKFSTFTSSFVGSFTNTIGVLGFIYLFFKVPYAHVKQVGIHALFDILLTIIGTSGLIEAIVTSILCTLIIKRVKRGD